MKQIILFIFLTVFFCSCETKRIENDKDTNIFNPDNTKEFKAVPGSDSIYLTWKNPTTNFDYIEIRRSAGIYPTDPTQGERVYKGNAESFLDNGLEGGVSYKYTIFTFLNNNHSSGIFQNARASKLSTIEDFDIDLEIGSLKLIWNKPANDLDFKGIKIISTTQDNTTAPNPNLSDAELTGLGYKKIYEKDMENFVCPDKCNFSDDDTGNLKINITYYYYIYSYDKNNKYSTTPIVKNVFSPARLGNFVLGEHQLHSVD